METSRTDFKSYTSASGIQKALESLYLRRFDIFFTFRMGTRGPFCRFRFGITKKTCHRRGFGRLAVCNCWLVNNTLPPMAVAVALTVKPSLAGVTNTGSIPSAGHYRKQGSSTSSRNQEMKEEIPVPEIELWTT